ncbi:uncharacterized protein LOC123037605 [Drosophila rhopaloa]|uniref:RNA-directed DNA polymerase n=1 Tax=Drosophila rhopaloa TaxID=1041015 RepID=A0ABM5J8M5_DRORH|nr:uncharacterized protein LOC123037605 [Drosophila rhopaloa]
MGKSWIYNLRKEDFDEMSQVLGIELEGSVDSMRKTLGDFVDQTAEEPDITDLVMGLEKKFRKMPTPKFKITTASAEDLIASLDVSSIASHASRQRENSRERKESFRTHTQDYAQVAKQVQEWNFRYDGNDKPLEFLEQEEWSVDLRSRHNPDPTSNAGAAPRQSLETWGDFIYSFLNYFLPRGYMAKLADQVRQRKQAHGESFKDFMVDIQTLMRPLNMSTKETLERIKENSTLALRMFVRPFECRNLDTLKALADEFEELDQQREKFELVAEPTSTKAKIRPGCGVQAVTGGPGRTTTKYAARPRTSKQSRRIRSKSYPGLPQMRGPDHWAKECRNQTAYVLLAVRKNRSSDGSVLFQVGKRPATPASEGRPGIARGCHSKLMGDLEAEEMQLSATVLIGESTIKATVDTGATASFISEELADRLQAAGRVGPTRRQVRMADGRCGEISSQLETKIGLETKTISMELLILPGLIDALVLGWNFLTRIGAEVECAGHSASIPAKNRRGGWLEEKLSVAIVETPKRFAEKDVEGFLKAELDELEGIKGTSNVAVHRITMKDDQPVKQRYYPKNPKMQGEINAKVDELLEKRCIEPSSSPYSSPIVMVRKKTGKWRLCVDFRRINARSMKDAYPIPMINYILDQLREAKYISSLDLKDGYWQIPLEADSRQYTAFTVPGKGLFQWKVMPFGLHSASATFQRALDQVIGPEMMPHAFAYQEDIGRTLKEHMENLKEVFRRLRAANLKVNAEKCKFFRKELQYLGHRITDQGIGTDAEKVSAIALIKPPANVKELRQYLGVASWYRRFVPDFATLVHPLNSLLRKSTKWEWTEDHQQAFEAVKARLTADPILACPDFTKTFVLQTDASDYGLGAILTQNSDQGERVISYSSRSLNGSERNFSATEKECRAIVWAIRKLRPYLEGYHFNVITNHMALKWLNSIESPTGRIARWALELQQYDFEIAYRKGQLNIVADALPRQPLPETCRRVKTQEQHKETGECNWIRDMRSKISQNPQKYPDYMTEVDQLYRHIPHRAGNEDVTSWKLCVPTGSRRRVMSENHNSPTAGHMGSRKTISRVAARYHWPGMHRDIRKYVQNCESCLRYKPSQLQAAGKMLTQVPEEPWATVCADFVGPLPRSKHGNSMLLVLVDRFSKWTEMVPMRRELTESLEKAIRDRILARYGVPKVLITDNGVQFTSRAFKKFLGELGVRHQFTAPYTPQENPTERANRTVKRMIAQFTGADQRTWDEKWPELQLVVNTKEGIRKLRPRTHRSLKKSSSEAKMEKAAQDQARHYNLRRRLWKPNIGDTVWAKEHHLSKAAAGFAAKLAPKYDGLFKIINFNSPRGPVGARSNGVPPWCRSPSPNPEWEDEERITDIELEEEEEEEAGVRPAGQEAEVATIDLPSSEEKEEEDKEDTGTETEGRSRIRADPVGRRSAIGPPEEAKRIFATRAEVVRRVFAQRAVARAAAAAREWQKRLDEAEAEEAAIWARPGPMEQSPPQAPPPPSPPLSLSQPPPLPSPPRAAAPPPPPPSPPRASTPPPPPWVPTPSPLPAKRLGGEPEFWEKGPLVWPTSGVPAARPPKVARLTSCPEPRSPPARPSVSRQHSADSSRWQEMAEEEWPPRVAAEANRQQRRARSSPWAKLLVVDGVRYRIRVSNGVVRVLRG